MFADALAAAEGSRFAHDAAALAVLDQCDLLFAAGVLKARYASLSAGTNSPRHAIIDALAIGVGSRTTHGRHRQRLPHQRPETQPKHRLPRADVAAVLDFKVSRYERPHESEIRRKLANGLGLFV
jgi:hypothetical protein